jgi:hypothetical protein
MAANGKDRKDVFISYARADGVDFVARLREKLAIHGISSWQDLHDMDSMSPTWRDSVRNAFKTVPLLVAVWTPKSVESDPVKWEIGEWNRDFMAVRALECNPPTPYKDKKYYDYAKGGEEGEAELDRLVAEIASQMYVDTKDPFYKVIIEKVTGNAIGIDGLPTNSKASAEVVIKNVRPVTTSKRGSKKTPNNDEPNTTIGIRFDTPGKEK